MNTLEGFQEIDSREIADGVEAKLLYRPRSKPAQLCVAEYDDVGVYCIHPIPSPEKASETLQDIIKARLAEKAVQATVEPLGEVEIPTPCDYQDLLGVISDNTLITRTKRGFSIHRNDEPGAREAMGIAREEFVGNRGYTNGQFDLLAGMVIDDLVSFHAEIERIAPNGFEYQ